jgi:hypothetical protein
LVAASDLSRIDSDSASIAVRYCETWVLPSWVIAVCRSAISWRFSATGASDQSMDSVPITVGMPNWYACAVRRPSWRRSSSALPLETAAVASAFFAAASAVCASFSAFV